DLVSHLQRAGSAGRERLVPYLAMAADRAVDAAAFEEAVDYLQQALGLVGEAQPDQRAELLERLALALRSVGEWDSAIATMDQSLTLYERLGRRDDVGRICSSIVYQLAWAARFEEAAVIARRGLEVLGDLVNPDRARLLSATGWALGLAGDHSRATVMFETARQILEQLDDRIAFADVLHMETAHHMSYVEFTQGADAGLWAAAVFEEEGALWDLCSVSAFAAYQQSTMGLLAEATATQDRVRDTAERIGHLGAQFLILADRARQDGVVPGDAERTDAIARQMIEICERAKLPWLYTGYMYRGFAASWVGDFEAAERHLRTAVELEPPGAFSGQSASLLALLFATRGRHDEALELVERYRDSFAVSGRVNSLGAWNTLFGFVEVLYLCGRTEEAGSFLSLIREGLDLGFEWFTFDCHLVNSRVALAAAGAGEGDQAGEHWHEAMRVAEAWGLRLEQADLLYLRTCMLKQRGRSEDIAAARESADEAGAAYRALGLAGREAIVSALVEHSTI